MRRFPEPTEGPINECPVAMELTHYKPSEWELITEKWPLHRYIIYAERSRVRSVYDEIRQKKEEMRQKSRKHL
jgi:hypothetical protein